MAPPFFFSPRLVQSGAVIRDDLSLETPRLLLRPLTEDDAPHVLTWARDPHVVANFSFFETEPTEERIRAYARAKRESPADLLLAIFEKDGSRYAGNCGLHEWDSVNLNARLGIILGEPAWGRGIAQEALSALLSAAFGTLGLHKIYLNVFTTNEKGRALYGKLGFREEGVLREEYRLRGTFRDMVRMGLLAGEWKSRIPESS